MSASARQPRSGDVADAAPTARAVARNAWRGNASEPTRVHSSGSERSVCARTRSSSPAARAAIGSGPRASATFAHNPRSWCSSLRNSQSHATTRSRRCGERTKSKPSRREPSEGAFEMHAARRTKRRNGAVKTPAKEARAVAVSRVAVSSATPDSTSGRYRDAPVFFVFFRGGLRERFREPSSFPSPSASPSSSFPSPVPP